jgi:hypothetical protein
MKTHSFFSCTIVLHSEMTTYANIKDGKTYRVTTEIVDNDGNKLEVLTTQEFPGKYYRDFLFNNKCVFALRHQLKKNEKWDGAHINSLAIAAALFEDEPRLPQQLKKAQERSAFLCKSIAQAELDDLTAASRLPEEV